MNFKYAFKDEDGSEKFEIGVVLARQYLGQGPWEVWDLRPDCEKWCRPCSTSAERLVRHTTMGLVPRSPNGDSWVSKELPPL
jgi:hypothetical protein